MESNKMVNADVKNTRTEFDLLGSREVPEDAYYGINTVRAMENFCISHSSMNDYPQFIYGMVQVKKAAAMANRELRLLPKDIADAIVSACDHILKDGYCITQFPVDVFQGGAGTSTNMNVNEVVANLALELMGHEKGTYKYCNPNDHVNLCQSTNDAYPCGLKLAFLEDLTSLYATMEFLAETLTLKAGEFEGVLKMGRTQLQDAVPMTLMEEFEAFALWVQNDIAHIKRCSKELLEFNLGGTAVGTGLNAVRGYAELAVGRLATNTGYPCILASNLVAASPDCGAYVAVHSALKRFAVRLSKICNDLRLMSSGPRAGLGEIQLPERQAGSSIMPAKVNPVIPEVVNQVCFKVCGNDTTITMAAEAGQLQLNVMEPVIAECMFQSISLLRNASQSLAEKCITGIRANVDRCESNVMNSIGIVTYLCPQLGHHLCDIIGRECVKSGKSVRQVVEEQKLLPMEVLDDIFSKANLQYPRDTAERFD